MAKSTRSSTRKANNRRLASSVFGPAETARAERLSAKLLELAKQPKPESSDANMEGAYIPSQCSKDSEKEDRKTNRERLLTYHLQKTPILSKTSPRPVMRLVRTTKYSIQTVC